MSAVLDTATPSSVVDRIEPRRWAALAIVLLAAAMDIIDTSIVVVGYPRSKGIYGASYSAMEWTTTAYTLAFALGPITGGRVGDIFGRKRMFLFGVAGFTLASALCGLAQDPARLVGARALQGAMAAVMVPQVLSIIQVSFPPRERGAAYGAMLGLGAVAGPLLGGGDRPVDPARPATGIGAARRGRLLPRGGHRSARAGPPADAPTRIDDRTADLLLPRLSGHPGGVAALGRARHRCRLGPSSVGGLDRAPGSPSYRSCFSR